MMIQGKIINRFSLNGTQVINNSVPLRVSVLKPQQYFDFKR